MRDLLVWLVVSGALVAIGLAVVRLLRGPSQADRIVALDVVFSSSIALAAASALVSGRSLFLDIGVGLSIVGFVATVLWARLIDKSPHDPELKEPFKGGHTGKSTDKEAFG